MSFFNYNIRYKIKVVLILVFLTLSSLMLKAQADRKFIREGNRQYEKDKFSESEISYRKAIDKNKGSADAVFNAGDALYRQKKYEDAVKQFIQSQGMNEQKDKKSESLYNMGNSLLMANKLPESIEAYKNSLRLKPDNAEAKYNLAYAQDLLRQQQEQQKEQDKNKDQKDQKDQKNQNDKEDQNKQDKGKNEDQKQNEQQQDKDAQQQQKSISREDAERLLNAIANDEKNVQEKVKLAKASKERVKTIKNW